jgi:hypothetical protein
MAMTHDDFRHLDMNITGAALTALFALAGYGLLVHRPLTDMLAHDATLGRVDEMAASVAAKQSACAKQRVQIDMARQALSASQAALRPADSFGQTLAAITEIAQQCNVEVTRWQPIGVDQKAEYIVQRCLVEGRATFPALYAWFHDLEQKTTQLDVTHFRIQSEANDPTQPCRFECSIRVYAGVRPDATQMALAGG